MLRVTPLIGFGAGVERQVSVVHTDTASDVSSTNPVTFSSQALGDAAGDRIIVVAVEFSLVAGNSISSVSVAGVSATRRVQATQTPSGVFFAELWTAAVPTGTTGDIVVTKNAAVSHVGNIGVYAMYGASSAVPEDTATDITTTPSEAIDVSAGGVIIGTAWCSYNPLEGSNAAAWTNLDEVYDALVSSNTRHTGAFREFSTPQTGLTVSVSWTRVTASVFALASWKP